MMRAQAPHEKSKFLAVSRHRVGLVPKVATLRVTQQNCILSALAEQA